MCMFVRVCTAIKNCFFLVKKFSKGEKTQVPRQGSRPMSSMLEEWQFTDACQHLVYDNDVLHVVLY